MQDNQANSDNNSESTTRIYKNAPPKAAAVSGPRPKKSSTLVRFFLVLMVIGVGTFLGYIGWIIVAAIVCSLPNSNCK